MTTGGRAQLTAVTAALATCIAACGGSSHDASAGGAAARGGARAVKLVPVPVPALNVPHYRTRGSYPQVASSEVRFKKVNAALLGVLRDGQRRYAQVARRRVEHTPAAILRRYAGVYRTRPRPHLSSASTVVVSVLVEQRRLLPGGNDGDLWLSATVPVSTGSRIVLLDLFAQPSRGLRALAAAVRDRTLKSNRCVRHASPYYRNAFAPTKRRYRKFALTPGGLAVGFDLAEVADPYCGKVVTTVPYAVVRPYLSKLGQKLVAGVRPSR